MRKWRPSRAAQVEVALEAPPESRSGEAARNRSHRAQAAVTALQVLDELQAVQVLRVLQALQVLHELQWALQPALQAPRRWPLQPLR